MTRVINKRVCIASGVRGDTRRYRTIHLFEQCRLLGLNVTYSHVTDFQFQAKVDQAHLLVLHRAAWDPNIQQAIESVHQRGGRVIFDTDDLLFDPNAFQWIDSPDFADPVRSGLYRDDMMRYRRTMESCDAIMTSTEYLAKQAVAFNLPTFVYRNGFSSEMLTISDKASNQVKKDPEKIIVGYASGTLTHNRDFDMISPEIRRVLDVNKNVSLWLVGPLKLDRGWAAYRARIIHLPHVPWRLLPGYLSRFDINLAPLVTGNPFAQSKSEIKWMEAALVRVPTITSATEAFRSAIREGKTGFLALTPAEWYSSLIRLIQDPDLRKKVGEAAYEQVVRNYNPQVRGDQFQKILEQVYPKKEWAVNSQRSVHKANATGELLELPRNKDLAVLEKSPSLFRMAAYALRYRGISTLIKQVWVFFRRLISPIIPYRKNTGRHGNR